jgi:hypothetical protein
MQVSPRFFRLTVALSAALILFQTTFVASSARTQETSSGRTFDPDV